MQNINDNDNFVEIKNLTFYRGCRMIYDNLSLNVQKNKITAIVGPSGAGKTTLLKLIGAQLKPASGDIVVNNLSLKSASRKHIYQLRKTIGMLFQSGALFTDMTVFENVAFPLRVHTTLPEHAIQDIVYMKLQSVGLRGARSLMPSELSGGMTRRVALARAIALDPHFIMYDEPFVGQDPISLGVLTKLIKDLNSSLKITSLIVSHDIQETASIADYLYIIGTNHIIAHGSPNDLLNSTNPYTDQFMNGKPDGPVPFHYPACSYAKDLLGGLQA